MARWYAFLGANRTRVLTPDFPTKGEAEAWVRSQFGASLTFHVQSVASYEVSAEELAAFRRDLRGLPEGVGEAA